MPNKLFPTFAFLGFVLVLVPLPWHMHAWNAGTCLFMVWTAIGCLIHFINAILWDGNLELHSAIWCDISTKLIVGLSVALPCASLCINRRLYSIARVSQAHITSADKRRAVYIDVSIGIGFPIIVMALHYIVQGHRFDIFEDIGCWPATVNMSPAYPLVWMWPIVIGLISMVYSILSLRAFMQRRKEFNELLAMNGGLTVNRYFRLMALATLEITMTTPVAIYFLYLNLTTTPPIPWVSLADTHFNFSRIVYVPAFIVNSQPQLKLNFNLNRWLFPACALFFFAFFGLAEEARRNYKRLLYMIVKPFGMAPFSRQTIGRPQKVNFNLPSAYSTSVDERSEPGTHWDELSLKMSDNINDPLPTFVDHRLGSSGDASNIITFSKGVTSHPVSQDNSRHSTSLSTSDSSSPTATEASNTYVTSALGPVSTITCPHSDIFRSDPNRTHPVPSNSRQAAQTALPAMHCNIYSIPSPQSSYRRSNSSEISISSVYCPDVITSRYEASGNSGPSRTLHPDSTNLPHVEYK